MPRSSRTGTLEFDPEIEKTARRLRKETKQLKGEESTSSESEADLALDAPTSSDFEEEVMAQNPERTINEMTSLDLNQQPLCIEYPTLDVDFELKSGLIHLLPTFRGLAGDDPHKHLKEFHVVCSGMRPQGVTEEQVKLRAFPFSLDEKAKDWLYSLPSGSIIRLTEANRSLVDTASGGTLYDKTPTEARKLIKTMAFNTQQFGSRNDNPPRKVNEVSASIDERLDELTSLVKKFVVGDPQQVKTCGICTSRGHFIDTCPTLHEEPTEHVNAAGGYSGPSQRGYDHFFKTYNLGWRDHPNLRYDNQSQNFQKPPPPPQSNPNSVDNEHPKVFVPKPPFPERFAKSKKEEEEKDILETLRKVEVNIPLLDAIKQVPRYAKFLKEMCTNKSKLRGNERVSMGENVSTILQSKLPPKCKDPGTFSIPCQIGNFGIENAMCDLGASINVMPFAIYESLNVGPLKETGVVLQLADRSVVYPKGVLEDVLVQINELVFSADFYVLDMMGDNSPNSISILLGRPFLKTSRTKIDVDARILSMEFDNEVVSFYIDGVTKNFNDMHSIFLMDFIDPLVQENTMFDNGGAFKMTINKNLTSSPRTYKNKAFHEKISSRKKSSMDHQVFLNPHHHRVHCIEEVDLKCPTYLS
ncbi:UNVERIFIED_CONTAM: hypothetical protein Slati_0772900 [Sesamum latifolium]|uniref:Retrotransposon gag domain-containing protein n=1 Tax=Sesamum latifolium TaxID=2727402 RepID=A0AAW2XN19_9LAMI